MKTSIILALLFSQLSFSKTQVASDKGALKAAVLDAGKINSVVSGAATPVTSCTEEVVDLNRDVLTKGTDIKVKVCRPDATSLTTSTGEDYTQFIRDNNISFSGNQATITASRDWRLFVHEFRKFPADLMREMVSVGGRIRIIVGNGVSEDSEWAVERQRAIDLARAYREWYNNPKTTAKAKENAQPPMSDAEAAKGFDVTTEGGRQWDVVSGAGGVFSNRNAISPTRIVINRMYKSAHREADGSISFNRDQGASNLFLHEHGHALDNLYGAHTISRSPEWRRLKAIPAIDTYLKKIFSSYEHDHDEEGFAEAFSYYHACEASRTQMETEAPELADYFKNFNVNTLRALRPSH